jgi:hypothetical protein
MMLAYHCSARVMTNLRPSTPALRLALPIASPHG